MNDAAVWMRPDVKHEIAWLEQRVDALKQRIERPASPSDSMGEGGEAEVRAILSARRTRETIIGAELFADPAWDILLELYAAAIAQRRLSVSELAAASAIPPTTALRWIAKLESAGLLHRSDDPFDGRRIWVEISAEGERRMRACFDAIRARVSLI